MVKLSLSSPKGNSGLRYFPYSGYLGLTPVRIDGVVRTRLEDDQKVLQAKSITISVRCYETRTKVGTNFTNVLVDYTQVLWSKPDAVEYEAIGSLEFPFRISIPPKVAGFSNAVFVDYKCIWRIEAVLNHIPISGVGSRQIRHFDLSLVRYDVPSWLPIQSNPGPILDLQTNKPRAPKLRYSVNSPSTAIGPMDLVSIPLHLKPVDRDVSIRSASVIVERRISLNENHTPSTPLWFPEGLNSQPSNTSLRKSSSHSLSAPASSSWNNDGSFHSEVDPPSSSSASTITPDTFNSCAASQANASPHPPAISPNALSSSTTKVVVNPITGAESSGSFTQDQNGVFSKTLTLQWPSSKSQSRWAIGETITSDLVSVKFFLRTKVVVGSSSGTGTIELADKELFVVSTNEAERQLAIARYNEWQETTSVGSSTRSKSKSPKRSKTEGGSIPPSPSVNSIAFCSGNAVDSADGDGGQVPSEPVYNGKRTRRPHTSAGPRDKPINFAGKAYVSRGAEGDATTTVIASPRSGQASSGQGCLGNGDSANGVAIKKQPKRYSEMSMKTAINRPEYESYTSLKKSVIGGWRGIGIGNLEVNRSSASAMPSSGASTPLKTNDPSRKSKPKRKASTSSGSSGSMSVNTTGTRDGSSDSSSDVREWEKELARIEARSRESSKLFALARKMKKTMVNFATNPSGIVGSD